MTFIGRCEHTGNIGVAFGRHYRRDEEPHCFRLYSGSETTDGLRDTRFRVQRVRRFGDYVLHASMVGFVAGKPK